MRKKDLEDLPVPGPSSCLQEGATPPLSVTPKASTVESLAEALREAFEPEAVDGMLSSKLVNGVVQRRYSFVLDPSYVVLRPFEKSRVEMKAEFAATGKEPFRHSLTESERETLRKYLPDWSPDEELPPLDRLRQMLLKHGYSFDAIRQITVPELVDFLRSQDPTPQPVSVERTQTPKTDVARGLPEWLPRQPKSWADVTILLQEQDDRVRVRVGAEKSSLVTAELLKMTHKQCRTPVESFRFLRELLSTGNHTIEPGNLRVTPGTLRKRVNRLNRDLRNAFNIDSNAIENLQTMARRWRSEHPSEPSPQDIRDGQYSIMFRLESDITH